MIARHEPIVSVKAALLAAFIVAAAFLALMILPALSSSAAAAVRPAGCPTRWCGCWLGKHLGMHDRSLWRARAWAGVGADAGAPGIGVVVVWRSHVGIITGRAPDGWVVTSGNDGRQVRSRVRSLRGAIAFRRVHRGWASQ